ncbi:MAG: hypothetical protein MUC54_03345 [Chloroflexi bacterium]|nr:hypothetical protein [Chloroflexota bacterium]
MNAQRGGAAARTDKVRAARITDLAALGEMSRLCQAGEPGTRSLGLPVSGPPIGMFSLFRFPLGALRPHDLLYVYESDGRLAGLLRAEREAQRDEWTIVELDGVGMADAGDIRFQLVQHCLRDGGRRGAARFHVSCLDTGGNVALFMQAGFARYGEELLHYRPPGLPVAAASDAGIEDAVRPAEALDSLALARLYAAVTPVPVQRLEGYRLADWERQGAQWRVPRSSLTPILRFADVEAFVLPAPGGGRDGTELAGFVQVGVAKEDQPDYLRVLVRPGVDAGDLVRFGLGVIAARGDRGTGRPDRGILSPVRTYESPLEHRLEGEGFEFVAGVTLLLKETLVRVAEPALVPAIR